MSENFEQDLQNEILRLNRERLNRNEVIYVSVMAGLATGSFILAAKLGWDAFRKRRTAK